MILKAGKNYFDPIIKKKPGYLFTGNLAFGSTTACIPSPQQHAVSLKKLG
jgi:hypothetical protein